MPWIESHQELRSHPKTNLASRALGIPRAHLIGHLHCLWWWAEDYAPDGDLSDFADEYIAEAAEWKGDAEAFVRALVDCGPGDSVGFIERDSDGTRLHDWDDYGSQNKKRQYESSRKRRQRAERKRRSPKKASPDSPHSVPGPSQDALQNVPEDRQTGQTDRQTDKPSLRSGPNGVADGSVGDAVAGTPPPDAGTPLPDVADTGDQPSTGSGQTSTPPAARTGTPPAPTAKGQIADLVAHYREVTGADPKDRDHALMGRLYNTHPIERIYDAIEATAVQIAAGQPIKDPLLYAAGVLKQPPNGRARSPDDDGKTWLEHLPPEERQDAKRGGRQ